MQLTSGNAAGSRAGADTLRRSISSVRRTFSGRDAYLQGRLDRERERLQRLPHVRLVVGV